jgi:hypothetical protein
MSDDRPEGIRWPGEFAPERTSIHVRNELAMDSPPERVWAWLVRARGWPDWYENSRNVRFDDGEGPDLAAGRRFRWWTFGVNLRSQVKEFEPCRRLAWDARGLGVNAYHAWLIRQTDGGCHVVTEETQHGFLVRAGKLLFPNRMYKFHQIWLESLRERARGGPPGP